MLDTQLHTQRYPHRSQDFPHRLRFTRVLLWSKDLSMWFCLPLCVWLSGLNTNSNEIGPEKRSPRTAFPPGRKRSSQKAEKASLLRARRGSQPACVCKPLFARNGLASPKGDLQICSEVGNSRGSVQGADCRWPTLQRHS